MDMKRIFFKRGAARRATACLIFPLLFVAMLTASPRVISQESVQSGGDGDQVGNVINRLASGINTDQAVKKDGFNCLFRQQ